MNLRALAKTLDELNWTVPHEMYFGGLAEDLEREWYNGTLNHTTGIDAQGNRRYALSEKGKLELNPPQEQQTFVTKDSGERIHFVTGSQRDTNKGKPRYDLIGWHMLRRLANLMARGAEKYGENNWKLGQPISRSYESALRHLIQWRSGDADEDHLLATIFNIMSIVEVQEQVKLDKLPKELLDIEDVHNG